ncbi:MAG: hypothetical protein HY014_16380 [Acidobacteria bacterium]|nr:hypothetical protein [Acidobacteriota bacterium]MBI3489708.1 hypothetical protein [Acidobacteriota bacterium]
MLRSALRSTSTLLLACLLSLDARAQTWTLPVKPPLKQSVPRTWRVMSEYQIMDLHGVILSRQRASALYTREGDRARWSHAELAFANGGTSTYSEGQPRAFMEGFSYPYAEAPNMTKAAFLKGFPQDASLERNLVWDTHMFEFFGQDWLGRLRLNEAFVVPPGESSSVDLAGTGTFRNHRIELTWTGLSQRQGRPCAVVDYRAFHNTLDLVVPAKLKGRSHYWGQIWLSQETGQVEYATLFEDVLGEISLPGQAIPMMMNVFRTATLEPLGK